MPKTEKPANQVASSKEDMLSAFVAEAPEKQTRKTATRADFVPDPDVLARVTAALTSTGAIAGAKGYGSEKEARKAGRPWRVYAEHAADNIEGKTISPKIIERDGAFFWKFQLATKRVRKDSEETASETASN